MTELQLEQQEIELEHKAIDEAKHKLVVGFISIIEQGRLSETPLGANLLRISLAPVVASIKEYFTVTIRGEHRYMRDKLSILFEDREQELAYILLNSILTNVSLQPMGIIKISNNLIRDINRVLSVEKLQKYEPKMYNYLEYEYKKRGSKFLKQRKMMLAKLKGFDTDNVEVTTRLGSQLIHIVLNSGIDLFTTINKGFNSMTKVGLSDKAMRIMSKQKDLMLSSVFTYNPMIVRPIPHTKLMGSGGYLIYEDISVVKQKKRHLKLIEQDFNQSTRMLSILNKVQDVEWNVNTRVLDVMCQVIDGNLVDPKSGTNNPKLFGGIPYMESMNVDDYVRKEDYGKVGSDDRFIEHSDYDKYYTAKTIQQGIIEKIVGKRFSYMFAIDTAKRYRDYEKFYFTYQFDYRYRLYPLQQHLNPQQTSNVKALLQFHNGCQLTDDGLYWLKIHGANCYGFDKEPYNVRIEKINHMLHNIQMVAKSPLDNLDLWAYADSPYEYLAFCFSLNDYLVDKTAIIYTPVALDATCSGLQIYSGLLRDKEGASSVNVVGNTRNDVYSKVAEVGNKLLASGNYSKELTFTTKDGVTKTINTSLEASSLLNNITRKLTKRNVMTTPYSVTARGMYDQIRELLTEDEIDDNIWWKGDKWVVAKLLTELNTTSIANVVKGASIGQAYIKEITAKITATNGYLKWMSPIYELPMVQNIPKEIVKRLRTPFGVLILRTPTDDINKQKMLSSIAPNFIHQLDATLMYRTVERCLEDGVSSFWLIHDSYGVLPNDVPILNKNVREAYIELFSEPILKDWVGQLGLEFDESVMINDLDLNEVRESSYIFS